MQCCRGATPQIGRKKNVVFEKVLADLEALNINRHRPMLVVDVDEVIVGLAAHLGEFAKTRGFVLRLTGYQLDGALKHKDGSTASTEEFRAVFTEFFEKETVRQRAYPDAPEVLRRLANHVQIVILTNVPPYAKAARAENLRSYGIDYPLVVNHGGKGKALAWLAGQTSKPVAFIDDSPTQISSAAKHAADVCRLHYVGDCDLRGLLGPLPDADHAPENWLEIEGIIHQVFGLKTAEPVKD